MRVERGHRHHSGPCTSGATAAGIEASPALQATADGRECADTHLELRCQRREHAARKRKSSHECKQRHGVPFVMKGACAQNYALEHRLKY